MTGCRSATAGAAGCGSSASLIRCRKPSSIMRSLAGAGRRPWCWPKRRLSLNIAADTDYCVLYTPPRRGFLLLEPVDHPINAMNLAGGACETA